MHPKGVDGTANSADPDQTAPKMRSCLIRVCNVCSELSSQGLRIFARSVGYKVVKQNVYPLQTIQTAIDKSGKSDIVPVFLLHKVICSGPPK